MRSLLRNALSLLIGVALLVDCSWAVCGCARLDLRADIFLQTAMNLSATQQVKPFNSGRRDVLSLYQQMIDHARAVHSTKRWAKDVAVHFHLNEEGPMPDLISFDQRRYEVRIWNLPYLGLVCGPGLVIIGSLVIIDETLFQKLNALFPLPVGSQLIRIHQLSFRNRNHEQGGIHFGLAAAVGLMQTPLSGKRLIEAGAGDGLLAIIGAVLGANELVLFENEPSLLLRLRENIHLNGLEKMTHIYSSDLRDEETVNHQLNALPVMPSVLSGNIGHYIDFTVTNLEILGLMGHRSEITDMVLGGYRFANSMGLDEPASEKEERYWNKVLAAHMGRARAFGFEIRDSFVAWPWYSLTAAAIVMKRIRASS